MNGFAQSLAALLFLKASLVVGAGYLASVLMRGRSAAARSAAWTTAFALLCALPLLAWIAPDWRPIPDRVSSLPPRVVLDATAAATAADVPMESPVAHAADVANIAMVMPVRPRLRPVALFALALWGAGALALLLRVALGALAVRRTAARSALPSAAVIRAAAEAAASLGIRRRVRLWSSRDLAIPVSFGVTTPTVMLPEAAEGWEPARLRVVLLHELAHTARWDVAVHLGAQLLRALYWMNPLVWLATRSAHEEQERATDDVVLRVGTTSADYADHLLQIARSYVAADGALGTALAMAHPSSIVTRIAAILARQRSRAPVGRRALATMAMVASVAAVPTATLTLTGESRDVVVERAALTSLSSASADDRARAAWLLGDLGTHNGVVPLAERALHDSAANVRGMAAWALGAIGDRNAELSLTMALGDHEPYVREMAVLALGRIGDPRTLPALAALSRDTAMGVRSVLTHALHGIGGERAGEILADMAEHDANAHTRDMATWSLQMSHTAASLPGLEALLRDTSAMMRRTAAQNLGQLADARAVPALVAALGADPDAEVRALAVDALGRLKDPAGTGPVAAALADTSWMVRAMAAGALGRLGGSRAVNALLAATHDPVHQVRLTAVEALDQLQQQQR